MYNYTVTMTP